MKNTIKKYIKLGEIFTCIERSFIYGMNQFSKLKRENMS